MTHFYRGSKGNNDVTFEPKPHEYKIDKNTGMVKPTHGISVFDNPHSLENKGFTPNLLDLASVPKTLQIKQRGSDPHHSEIMPLKSMQIEPYKEALRQIKVKTTD
ncbi:MAG: hypothetical protein DRR08_29335 [Candidatus Parabeggiatoa sp. nov. 2]|nr:MAG: hypothetical protein B6247_30625 [Beggiatoa sp. 4572_84]RKZ51395.1 MAG: hypothetical protein DRR08_29335 [Gammaproteobacteria bacterium]